MIALRLDEREQVLVDLVLVRRAHAVRRALVDLQRRALDDLGREQRRGADRHDLIVVAVQDQRRHVELLQVLGEVGLGKRLDAEIATPGMPAIMPCSQNESRTPSETFAPGRL